MLVFPLFLLLLAHAPGAQYGSYSDALRVSNAYDVAQQQVAPQGSVQHYVPGAAPTAVQVTLCWF